MKGKYVYPTFKYEFYKYQAYCSLGVMWMNEEAERANFAFHQNSSFIQLINEAIAHSYEMINY